MLHTFAILYKSFQLMYCLLWFLHSCWRQRFNYLRNSHVKCLTIRIAKNTSNMILVLHKSFQLNCISWSIHNLDVLAIFVRGFQRAVGITGRQTQTFMESGYWILHSAEKTTALIETIKNNIHLFCTGCC